MGIGERIRARRKELKIRQVELALKINRSAQVVSNWERGYTPVIPHDDVLALATTLETNPNYLLGLTDDPAPPHPKQEKPNYEEYVLSAGTLAEAAIRISELNDKYDLDEKTFLELHTLAYKKFGLKPVKSADDAAHTKHNAPATGVFEEDKKVLKRWNKV